MTNQKTIESMANKELFLSEREGYETFADLDGKYARKFLETNGFTVIKNYDTGRNGLAITQCGIALSTNGYIYKLKK